jgi:hypothetical protein
LEVGQRVEGVELKKRVPSVECIESVWTGDGFPVLAESLPQARGQHLTLWFPKGEVVFTRGANRLFAVHFIRSLFRNGEMLSGRVAVQLDESDSEYGEFVKSVVAAFRAVGRSGLTSLNGVPKPGYLIGPNALARASEGEIELLDAVAY